MGNWLAYAQSVEAQSNPSPDIPTKGDKSPDLDQIATFCTLLSGCQVEGQKKQRATEPRHEVAVLCAIERGQHRPGAIATDTQLGATVTYRLIDRLIASGRITQGRDGRLTLLECVSPGHANDSDL